MIAPPVPVGLPLCCDYAGSHLAPSGAWIETKPLGRTSTAYVLVSIGVSPRLGGAALLVEKGKTHG